MRTPALILLFPFAVFLTETAGFNPAVKGACAVVPAEKRYIAKNSPPGNCHKKKEKNCCTKMKKQDECNNKKGDGKNGNRCENKPDCNTCPVCYTFIVQPQYEWSAHRFVSPKNYGLLTTSYISVYTTNVWKPPNGLSV